MTICLIAIGTKGGLVTDSRARVRREDGTVIDDLYAAGNTMASATGHCYPSLGARIGTSMAFPTSPRSTWRMLDALASRAPGDPSN